MKKPWSLLSVALALAGCTRCASVGALPQATATASGVTGVQRLFVIPRFATLPVVRDAQGNDPVDLKATRFVVTVSGDDVKVYDPKLAPLFSLTGLSGPSMVVGDPQGRLYVADTGHDRIVRFLSDGTLDASFAARGAFAGATGKPLTHPLALAVGPSRAELILDGTTRMTCASSVRDADDKPTFTAWTDEIGCSGSDLAKFGAMRKLGVTHLERGAVRPTHLFSTQDHLEAFVTDSKLIAGDSMSLRWVEAAGEVLDVALAPTAFLDDFAVVDKAGKLQLFVEGRKTSSWDVGYPLTAIAAGADGTLYLAGNGHLEVRAFPRLR